MVNPKNPTPAKSLRQRPNADPKFFSPLETKPPAVPNRGTLEVFVFPPQKSKSLSRARLPTRPVLPPRLRASLAPKPLPSVPPSPNSPRQAPPDTGPIHLDFGSGQYFPAFQDAKKEIGAHGYAKPILLHIPQVGCSTKTGSPHPSHFPCVQDKPPSALSPSRQPHRPRTP